MSNYNDENPFLWAFIKQIKQITTQSGGEERPFTMTVSEENSPKLITTN